MPIILKCKKCGQNKLRYSVNSPLCEDCYLQLQKVKEEAESITYTPRYLWDNVGDDYGNEKADMFS